MKAHPLNSLGPFYVQDGCCLACDLPRSIAPDMFRYTELGDHCYVHHQPSNQDQLTRMVEAMEHQDLTCIRYRAEEPDLIELLRTKGMATECDALSRDGNA